jgi:hypothetical protein
MGIFDKLFTTGNKSSSLNMGLISYGKNKKDGSHDHRYNRDDDQTPAQKGGHIQAGKTKSGEK